MNMLRKATAVLLVLGAALFSGAASASDGDAFFEQSLGDFRAEIHAAQKAGKLGVLLMFEAEGCPYCRKMRQNVLNRQDVQSYFRQRFTAFPVDVLGDVPVTAPDGREMAEKKFAAAMKVRGTPTFVFLGPDGIEMARYAGATRDADEFMLLGRYVADGHYRSQSFDQFRANATKGKK